MRSSRLAVSTALALALLSSCCSSCAERTNRRSRPVVAPDAGLAGPRDAAPDTTPAPRDAGVSARDASPDDAGPADAGPPRRPPPGVLFAIEPSPTALVVRAGGATALDVDVLRAEGFDAPIAIDLFGLPPGVRASPESAVASAVDRKVTLRIEADSQALVGLDAPFSVQASAEGWVRHARITVRVEP